MIERVAGTIERYRMLGPGMHAGVAVSGGADSVCLLHVLVELAARWDLRLTVLHLNHNLRGEESRRDAEFVRDLAGRLGLPVIVREADVGASGDNLEQAARAARLAFFRDAMRGGGLDRIALGHTRSDQAETVLYRFLRGAGTAGLSGIRPVTTDGLIRPLLEVDRADVERFLRERAISWRDDSTNFNLAFARNRIRRELLPQLARDWNPAIGETLAHVGDWALAEESYWEAEIDRLAAARLVEKRGTVLMRVDSITGLPLAAARRLARRAMERAKGNLRGIDFRHVAAVVAMASRARGSGRVEAPGLDIRRSFEWLRFSRPEGQAAGYSVPAPVPGTVTVSGAETTISLELIEKSAGSDSLQYVYNEGTGALDWCRLRGALELRNWRPGDQYQPVGSAGDKKIRMLFQEARIPSWERRNWPVLTDGVSIVWARRFGPASRFAASTGSKVILLVREAQGAVGQPVGESGIGIGRGGV